MTLGLVPEEEMPDPVRFHVPGEPVSKARAKMRVHPDGKVSTYTPSGTAAAERAIAIVARAAGLRPSPRWDYSVVIAFRMASWQRRDIDNLIKLVLDALNGIAWKDDVQVRHISAALERGARPSEAGTTVIVRAMEAQRRGLACAGCGTWIEASPSSRRKYCSRACQTIRTRPARTISPNPDGRPQLHDRTPERDYQRDYKRRKRA